MHFNAMIDNISLAVYGKLQQTVELGKGSNSVHLMPEHTELSLQAVMAYNHNNKSAEKRVGYIDHGSKQAKCEADKIKWVGDDPEYQV